MTAQVDYENVMKALGSDRSMQQIDGDLRGFLTIPYRRSPLGRHVLAARVAAARTTGDVIPSREPRVGGTGVGELITFQTKDLPVRGYPTGTLRGRSAAIGSVEYRFPLYEIERGPSTYPLFFNRIVGDLFSDAGRASQQTIASAGAEIAFDVTLGFFVPLRYRMGVAYRLREPGRGDLRPFAAIESSF